MISNCHLDMLSNGLDEQWFRFHRMSYNVFFSFQGESSSGITEESEHAKQWKRPNLFVEIPSKSSDAANQESVQVKMLSTPTPTPKRVNFLLTPSPSNSRVNAFPSPSSCRGKSSIKNLLPRLSFKLRNMNSDTEKATLPDSDTSAMVPQEKVSIPRSWSFTKLFTPRVKRTSSLPVTPIDHSNPESASGSMSRALTFGVSDLYKVCLFRCCFILNICLFQSSVHLDGVSF